MRHLLGEVITHTGQSFTNGFSQMISYHCKMNIFNMLLKLNMTSMWVLGNFDELFPLYAIFYQMND